MSDQETKLHAHFQAATETYANDVKLYGGSMLTLVTHKDLPGVIMRKENASTLALTDSRLRAVFPLIFSYNELTRLEVLLLERVSLKVMERIAKRIEANNENGSHN